MGASGWFDESSDNSGGIYAFIQGIQTSIEGEWTDGRVNSKVLQEVLADLKTARSFCSTLIIGFWTLVKNKK